MLMVMSTCYYRKKKCGAFKVRFQIYALNSKATTIALWGGHCSLSCKDNRQNRRLHIEKLNLPAYVHLGDGLYIVKFRDVVHFPFFTRGELRLGVSEGKILYLNVHSVKVLVHHGSFYSVKNFVATLYISRPY